MIEEALPAILNRDPLGDYLSHWNLGLFDLGSMIGELDSTLDSTPYLESSSWLSSYELLPPLTISLMPPSIVSPPKVELKSPPNSLKYLSLGPKRPYLS